MIIMQENRTEISIIPVTTGPESATTRSFIPGGVTQMDAVPDSTAPGKVVMESGSQAGMDTVAGINYQRNRKQGNRGQTTF